MKRIINSYKNEGARATIRKIKSRLLHPSQEGNQIVKVDMNSLPQMPQFIDLAKADYINHPYIRPAKLTKEKLNIAWVSPPVGPGGGGHTTISRFVKYLQRQGHRITFYIYHNNTIPQSAKEAREIFSARMVLMWL